MEFSVWTAHLMQPATVTRWHRTAFRFFWRWKSRRPTGRPPISKAMQDLIRKLSRENSLWGAERIRDTLVLLSYDPPCDDTIRKYMVSGVAWPRRPERLVRHRRTQPRTQRPADSKTR
jgi:hypothetical protein